MLRQQNISPAWLLLAGLFACGSRPADGPVLEGQSAGIVDFELPTLSGEVVRLSHFRPQVVLVTYFATWCAPCLDDLPALAQLDQQRDDLTVIAINIDTEPKVLLPPFLDLVPLSFAVLLADAATLDGKTPFGHLAAIPASYLLDSTGKHVQTFLGPTPIDYLERRVTVLAEETR